MLAVKRSSTSRENLPSQSGQPEVGCRLEGHLKTEKGNFLADRSISINSHVTRINRKDDFFLGAVDEAAFHNRIYFYDFIKRGMDLVGALLLFTILSPLMLITAFLIRTTSSGPAIFRQKRLTQGGREFTMYKFRTMTYDAEEGTGAIWAADDDPRRTKLGPFLRKTHIDELPQLINVLVGNMSLIGPRPERPEIAAKLSDELPHFSRRLEVKAGITGLAQIAMGYASSVHAYRRKLALDIQYVQERCLSLDLRIALRTLGVIFTGHRAR